VAAPEGKRPQGAVERKRRAACERGNNAKTPHPCSVNEANVALMRRRWVEAGKPQWPDWKALMEGMTDE
jgi:hypothetical protein